MQHANSRINLEAFFKPSFEHCIIFQHQVLICFALSSSSPTLLLTRFAAVTSLLPHRSTATMSESTIVPSSSSNEGSSNGSNPILEERLAFMAKHVENVQKLNPDQDLKVETQWWVPSVTLGVDLGVSYHEPTFLAPERIKSWLISVASFRRASIKRPTTS